METRRRGRPGEPGVPGSAKEKAFQAEGLTEVRGET